MGSQPWTQRQEFRNHLISVSNLNSLFCATRLRGRHLNMFNNSLLLPSQYNVEMICFRGELSRLIFRILWSYNSFICDNNCFSVIWNTVRTLTFSLMTKEILHLGRKTIQKCSLPACSQLLTPFLAMVLFLCAVLLIYLFHDLGNVILCRLSARVCDYFEQDTVILLHFVGRFLWLFHHYAKWVSTEKLCCTTTHFIFSP